MGQTSLIIKVLTEYNADQLKDADKDLDKLGKSASKLGLVAKGALVGAGVAAVKFGADSIRSFTNFDKGMREVFTLLPGISNDAMERMKSGVLDFSKEAGRLPEEVIPAVYQSISAGVPQENVFDFMKVASQAAEGGVTDLETAVDGITSSMNAYGSETLSAAMASDLMFTAVKGGKTDFAQLSNSLFNVVPIASSLGVEFGNVTAALAAMTAQGVPTSVATTQLRQLFVELSKDGSKTATLFESLAGKSFKQFVAEGGNVQQALQLLEQHAASTGVGVNDLFGSVEAGSAALTLTGKGTAKFAAELEAAEAAMGATAEASDTMGGSVDKSVRQMQAQFEALKVQVGEELAPVAVTAMGLISDAIEAVGPKLATVAANADTVANSVSGSMAETTTSLIQGNIDNAKSIEDLIVSGQRLVRTYDDIGSGGRLLTGTNKDFEQGFKDTLTAIAEQSDSLEDYEEIVKAVIGESDRLVGSYGVLHGEVTDYTKELYAQTKATELARKEGRLWTAALEAVGSVGYVPAGEAAERLSSRLETQKVLMGEAQQLSEQMARVLQQQAAATDEAEVATEDLGDTAVTTGGNLERLIQITRQSTDVQLTAAGELFDAYDDLADAQGEYVTVYSDNSSKIAEIQAQLMADLSDEQEEGLQEQLDGLNEFSPEAIAIWNQLQGDITESQRRSLISQLADLQGAHGEMRSVYTGDAVAAEEAQERINAAMGEITSGYQTMTLKIIEAKLAEKFGEDSVAIELAMIGVREAMGLITPEQAEMEQALVQSGERLQRSLSVVLDGFLEDNYLSQYEMGVLATITETASNNMQGSLGEMGGAATTATETVIGLKDASQEFLDGGPYEPVVGIDDQATPTIEDIKRGLAGIPDEEVTVTVQYQQGPPPPGVGNLPAPNVNIPIPGSSAGGLITGGRPNKDSVLMMLMPGEFVLQKSAVERLGVGAVNKLNQGDAPSAALAMVPGFNGQGSGAPTLSFQSNDKLLFLVNDKNSAALAASLASQQRRKAVMDVMGY